MDDFSWGTTRVTADDSKSKRAITSDALDEDEEQGSSGGGAESKASSTDTSEDGGDSFKAEESNKANTDKVTTDADVDEELGCREAETEKSKASPAEALGGRTSKIPAANDEERMNSFLYANLDSSTNQIVELREIR